MIITKLAGGLGNQMFQYATGRRLALANQSELLLDLSFYHSKYNFAESDTRVFSLDEWQINAARATRAQVKKVAGNRYLRRLGFLKPSYFAEKQLNVFAPELLKLRGDFYLDGFWQSAKYFLDIRPTLLQDFSLKRELILPPELSDWLNEGVVVAVHCRRGDYVAKEKVKQVHGSCSLAYYQQALKLLNERLPSFRLLIFSDDPTWAKANLKFAVPTKFAAVYQLSDCQEIVLMSRCQHQIIANSSFSWWGAWLNTNSQKIVVAPQHWYQEASLNSPDILPAAWLKI